MNKDKRKKKYLIRCLKGLMQHQEKIGRRFVESIISAQEIISLLESIFKSH